MNNQLQITKLNASESHRQLTIYDEKLDYQQLEGNWNRICHDQHCQLPHQEPSSFPRPIRMFFYTLSLY